MSIDFSLFIKQIKKIYKIKIFLEYIVIILYNMLDTKSIYSNKQIIVLQVDSGAVPDASTKWGRHMHRYLLRGLFFYSARHDRNSSKI